MGAITTMTNSDQIRHHAANGMDTAQIAGVVGVSAGYVRSVLSRDNRNSATAPETRATSPKRATVAVVSATETAQQNETISVLPGETDESKIVKHNAAETPAANELPGVSKPDFITPIFRTLYGAGIVGHAVLIWHECKYLWGDAGAIAGLVVGIVIVGAVVLMVNDRHKEQADNLLWFVWFLDGAAWFVHKAALWHQGTTAYGAGITEIGTGCLAAVICLCAMALAYFYKETGK